MVLLDEVGSGTNPQQGEAIGRAVVEELAKNELCRVIGTTHFELVKELALKDPKFKVGRMEFLDNSPTFKLLEGVGESYAIKVAERVGLGEDVVRRAEELMGEEGRMVGEVLEELENERLVEGWGRECLKVKHKLLYRTSTLLTPHPFCTIRISLQD